MCKYFKRGKERCGHKSKPCHLRGSRKSEGTKETQLNFEFAYKNVVCVNNIQIVPDAKANVEICLLYSRFGKGCGNVFFKT